MNLNKQLFVHFYPSFIHPITIHLSSFQIYIGEIIDMEEFIAVYAAQINLDFWLQHFQFLWLCWQISTKHNISFAALHIFSNSWQKRMVNSAWKWIECSNFILTLPLLYALSLSMLNGRWSIQPKTCTKIKTSFTAILPMNDSI